MKNMIVVILTAATLTGIGSSAFSQERSFLCKFTGGPRSGQVQDYTGHPAGPLPVGSSCQDGMNPRSDGVIIPSGSKPDQPQERSFLCKFTSGPRSGQVQDYTGHPSGPLPVGSSCQDGNNPQSSGAIISAGGKKDKK